MFVDGDWVAASGDRSVEVTDPATEEVIAAVPDASPEDVGLAVRSAREAFDRGPWPHLGVRERSDLLLGLADAIEDRRQDLTELNIAEAGSVWSAAEHVQVGFPIELLRDMAGRVLPGFGFDRPLLPQLRVWAASRGPARR